VLQVSKTHREQYQEVSEEQLQEYVEDLHEAKVAKSSGRQVTAKSKVMDIHHMFSELQTIVRACVNITTVSTESIMKLTGLDAHVGIRAMIFLVRASNEYNQIPLFYATDTAAAEFIPKVFALDVNDIMSKFEGYSIAGGALAGMATSYKEKVHAAKKEISAKLNMLLREYGPQLHHNALLLTISHHQVRSQVSLAHIWSIRISIETSLSSVEFSLSAGHSRSYRALDPWDHHCQHSQRS
jgi:hypothetical protein